MHIINIIGAGLAGCEAAWQIARKNIKVRLFEMKPQKFSPAHHSDGLAELVCSNSFKAKNPENASGLLKEEMRLLDSLVLNAADNASIPAGGALAVDRDIFSSFITDAIARASNIELIRTEIEAIAALPPADALIIATGPLTSDKLAEDILKWSGLNVLSFYDAAAPVIFYDSIDKSKVFKAARYSKGSADYINCPMSKAEYIAFYNALIRAECADVKGFDELHLYEGCMPVESMAKRGEDTLRFGPMKPVGLVDPENTDRKPYAVAQLRQDNSEGTLFNMVGFQTRLKFGEQRRVFGMIPGLESAKFARFGVMHRNTYIKSPGFLSASYRVKKHPEPVFFAGQIAGVEGYIESASSGMIAGINAARTVLNEAELIFPPKTMTGALAAYVSNFKGGDFQPMGANFGIMVSGEETPKTGDKNERKRYIAAGALEEIRKLKGII